MAINKTYDIGQLVETLQTEIENSKKYNRVVKLDILTANDILDVLNETNKRGQRHQTLCDDCLMKSCCNVDCTHEHITEQMLGDLEECFGKSYSKRPTFVCMNCKYKEQCKELTKHAEA